MFNKNKNYTLQGYNLADYDFLDLGSGTGESIEYCIKRFSAKKGLGIDIKEDKVLKAKQREIPTIHADILELSVPYKFKFISMMDFLEHLPGIDFSKRIIEKASELATDFLYIRHPSFEDIEYLNSLGLKLTWHDWQGHKSLLRITDYVEIFDRLGLRKYCFNFRLPILDTSHKFIVPSNVPQDTHQYDPEKHPEKKMIKFSRTLYGQIDIFVQIKDIDAKTWNAITNDVNANL